MKKKLIIFSIAILSLKLSFGVSPNWQMNTSNYEFSMQVICLAKVEGLELINTNDKIGAFVGDECRGVAQPIYIASINRNIFYLSVMSNTSSDETITFKIYDAGNDRVLDALNALPFGVNKATGSAKSPYVVGTAGMVTGIAMQVNNFNENMPLQSVVANLSTLYNGNTLVSTYSLVDGFADNSEFSISGNQLLTSSPMNFELQSNYSIKLKSSHADYTVEQTFDLLLSDLNEAPTAISLSKSSIAENVAKGSTVGLLNVDDEDAIESFIFELLEGGSVFDIAGNVLRTKVLLNYDNNTSYTLKVKVTDKGSNTLVYDLIVTVEDVVDETIVCPQHFYSVWEGTNGQDQMNIYIKGAELNGVALKAGDEIAAYDGTLCVGKAKLTTTINAENILQMIVSHDDGTGNGYTIGNSLVFKYWVCSENKEFETIEVTFFDDVPSWETSGTFQINATSFVGLSCISERCVSLDFVKGWNIFSVNNSAYNSSLLNLFQTMISEGKLTKIQDETGTSLENWGILGGWVNNIGNIQPTEGYKIKVNEAISFDVCGEPLTFPYEIALTIGWNVISFPHSSSVDALKVIQQLIDRGTLIKIQDEEGNSLENWGVLGGWMNNIGNFEPGKGYKMKVNSNETLVIFNTYL
ncbi:MAG: cadherin repeat domain-containing protein [Prolixibacteraceae bacterium]